MANKRVAFYTLGCKLNYSETASLERKFLEEGYQKVPFPQEADIYVINTCTVTERADKKCRNAIRRAVKSSPDAKVAVIGCYAQIKSSEIAAIPGVDLVLGNHEKYNIAEYLNHYLPERTSAPIIKTCNIE